MVKRVVTGAHYGLRDWLGQRVTALVLLLYTLFLAGWLWLYPLDYDHWTMLFSSNLMRSFTLLSFLALCYHAWIGVRDIVMDYIKSAARRLVLHVLVLLVLLLYVIWSVQILWGL